MASTLKREPRRDQGTRSTLTHDSPTQPLASIKPLSRSRRTTHSGESARTGLLPRMVFSSAIAGAARKIVGLQRWDGSQAVLFRGLPLLGRFGLHPFIRN